MHDTAGKDRKFDMYTRAPDKILMGGLLALFALGCGGGGGDTGSNIRFTDVICLPDGATPIVEGAQVTCTFRVEGPPGTEVALRCEDDAGGEIDCGSASRTQLQPFGVNALPIQDGFFSTTTEGMAGMTAAVVWVADSDAGQARHRFAVEVIADDGVNEPPSIEFDCGGDTDGNIDIQAGDELICDLRFVDPDPDLLTWSYEVVGGATPANEPMPFGGSAIAPAAFEWRWQTATGEASMTYTMRFSVSDGTAPAVTRDLVVAVQ